MTMGAGRYMALETVISIIANTVLVTAVGILVFGQKQTVSVWAPGGVEFDILLQTSTVAFFSSLVPGLLTRWRIRRGKVGRGGAPLVRLPSSLFLQSLLIALIAIVLVVPGATALIEWQAKASLPLVPFLAFKMILTVIASAVATPIGLSAILAKAPEVSVP